MLKQKLNYVWRLAATGLSFGSFGVGGAGLSLALPTLLKLLESDVEQRQVLAQKIIQHSFKSLVLMMQKLGVMSYEIQGLEQLENSYGELLLANHPTLIDVVMLIAFMPQANCVVKQSLWSNPFTKGAVRSAGYILNQGSQQFVEACVSKLQAKGAGSLIIFPEGTRTEKQQVLNDFQRGAANIALRAKVPIRPVVIRCSPSTLSKNQKWYHIPARRFHIQMQVLAAIPVAEILPEAELNPKSVRQLNAWLYDFFHAELYKCKT